MIEFLLKLFGLWCDPEEARGVPQKERAERPKTAGNHFGKDIRFRDGRTFKTKWTPDGLEEVEENSGRDGGQTKGDLFIFTLQEWSDKGEDIVKKYFELKPYWARGLSAKETSKIFSGKYGYGERTLEKFWAAFFRSQEFDLTKTKTKEQLHDVIK